MNQILGTDNSSPHNPPPTLSEIQRRACKIHYERGEVSGGYTLDDWLKAEHELERKLTPAGGKDRVH